MTELERAFQLARSGRVAGHVVTETLVVDHGDTDTMPMPAPSISSARDGADATTAPATMAPQDTAEAPLSGLASSSRAFKILPKARPTSRWTCEISSEIENEASERSGVSDREER